MLKDTSNRVIFIPSDITRYDKDVIYCGDREIRCDVGVVAAEFGGQSVVWRPNPRCMLNGKPQRNDDLLVSCELPRKEKEADLAKMIMTNFFYSRGIAIEGELG